MAGEVLTCIDYDATTETCAQSVFLPAPSFLPALSVGDAVVLGSAIVFNLAYAWCWKRAEKVVRQ